MKKAAVIVYDLFSMQEISCLTELFCFADKEICVFAATLDPVKSEDGFTILPQKTFDEFQREEYDCIILPGIWDGGEKAIKDERHAQFLAQFKEDDILIAAISSAPILLAQAGLLENRRFFSGLFEEIFDELDFLQKVYHNILRKPVVHDHNIITAIGFAFREFAVEVLKALDMPCSDTIFSGVTKEYTEAELTYHFRSYEEQFEDLRE